MTKKILFLASTMLALTLTSNAQLLWKVSGNGLAKPSYLFGTHHLIEQSQIANFDKAASICKETDAVIGEMDLSDMAGIQAKIMQGAMLQGTTYKELLSSEDYALVDNEFKQLMGAGLDQMGMMKPMMLTTIYALVVYMKMTGAAKQPEAIDLFFQKTAKDNGKKVIGLETADQQTDILFNTLPVKRQAEVLVKSIKEKQKDMEDMKNLNTAYLAGDLQKAEAIDKDDDTMTQDEKKIMIDNRNDNWIKQLPALFREQSCFVAVGFLHLAGNSGLISQLKKAGYTVEPITLK
jgi:uncharacterized protein YbaP (TraB family)